MMKFKITATIPTGQYANIMPEIEVEAETYEQAQAEALQKLESIWARYAVVPLNSAGKTVRLTDYFGNEIDYDEANHMYSWKGEVYLSGSQYAESFRKPFDKQRIAEAMAKRVDADPQEIIRMWELKSQVSMDFGNAIHGALQLYEQFNGLAAQLNKTTHSHDHPVIKKAVDSFMEAHKGEKVLSEVLVVDHKNKRAGRIDRLVIDDKILSESEKLRVEDFKTNADIQKELAFYWKQLGFYSDILEANGAKVVPPKIHHFDGEWHEYEEKA